MSRVLGVPGMADHRGWLKKYVQKESGRRCVGGCLLRPVCLGCWAQVRVNVGRHSRVGLSWTCRSGGEGSMDTTALVCGWPGI